MKVDIEKDLGKSEAKLKISVEPDELTPYLKEAANKLSKKKVLPGFRPGKAPVEVVEEAFGTQRLYNEALDRAIPRFFVQAVLDENIDTIARPSVSIDKLEPGKKLLFTAVVTILPEVEIGDLSKIEVENKKISVSDNEAEREMKVLAKTRSTYLDVARPAQKGDVVKIDFKISIDGKVIEGGESKDQAVPLGEGHFMGDFEKKLEGIQANDFKEFEITFPSDYGKKELQGKKAQVQVKAKAVQKRVLPKLDDEFAKTTGKFQTIEELKKALKDNLKVEKESKEKEKRQGEMAEKLSEAASFSHIPDVLIEREIERRLQELSGMLALQKKNLDDYLQAKNKKVEDIKKELRPAAERNVKVGLALKKFAEQEKLQVTESEVQEKVSEYLKRFTSAKEAKEKVDVEELKENITYMLRNQRAMERLESKIIIKEVK